MEGTCTLPHNHVDAGGGGAVEGQEGGADHGRRRQPEEPEGQHPAHRARLPHRRCLHTESPHKPYTTTTNTNTTTTTTTTTTTPTLSSYGATT
jgi:hypothetical protein